MKEVIYDGTWEGFLCAVFDVYEYKLNDVSIVPIHKRQPTMFAEAHFVNHDKKHSERVWKGLEKKLSLVAQKQVYHTFLSELDGIENSLLQYMQHAFALDTPIEEDFSQKAVQTVFETSKKVVREKNRIAALMDFQQANNNLNYAIINPQYNVVPLLANDFKNRFADQTWMIYDAHRRYGMYYDLNAVTTVEISFGNRAKDDQPILSAHHESEAIYQQLGKHYFKSNYIGTRRNTKLYILQTPRRYWKSLLEKTQQPQGGLQERLTNWTYRRAS